MQIKSVIFKELVSKLLNIYFPKNSIIYDPFMGIGTTARSCIEMNINYIGSELDNEHYQLSLSLL